MKGRRKKNRKERNWKKGTEGGKRKKGKQKNRINTGKEEWKIKGMRKRKYRRNECLKGFTKGKGEGNGRGNEGQNLI